MTDPWTQATLEAARRAVWNDDDWDGSIAHCLARIEPALGDPDGTVVDVGCGVGRLLHPLADRHPTWDCVGIDTSPSMLAHAYSRDAGPNVRYVMGGADQLLDQAPVGAVYSVVTFQHLPLIDQAAYVDAIGASLTPGGRACIQFVHDADFGPLSHPVERATMAGWFAAAGFGTVGTGNDDRYPTWTWLEAVKS